MSQDETETKAEAEQQAEQKPAPAVRPAMKLLELDDGLEIWRVSPLALKEQDKNARVQAPKTFKALVRNIKKRGALESLPFVSLFQGEFWIVSGHHRVRAAIEAGIETMPVLVDTRPRTRDEVVAKQVAHNSINGQDDPAVLLQLLDEIGDVDAMLEASVDRAAIEKLATAPVAATDVTVDYDWKVVTFAFLPKHVRDLEALVTALRPADLVLTAEVEAHEQLVAAMKAIGKRDGIRSMGAIAYRMVEIIGEYVRTKKDEKPAEKAGDAETVSP